MKNGMHVKMALAATAGTVADLEEMIVMPPVALRTESAGTETGTVPPVQPTTLPTVTSVSSAAPKNRLRVIWPPLLLPLVVAQVLRGGRGQKCRLSTVSKDARLRCYILFKTYPFLHVRVDLYSTYTCLNVFV